VYKDKECVICGKFYLPSVWSQKTCSSECSKEQTAIRKAKSYQENKEYRAEQMRQNHQRNKPARNEYGRKYRQAKKEQDIACLYLYRNKITGQGYIGETRRFEERQKEHKRELKSGRHHHKPLQKDYDKYGPGAFEFSIIKEINKEDFPNEGKLKEHLLEEEILHSALAVIEGKALYNTDPAIYAVARVIEKKKNTREEE
jgi:hypothetical protein